MGYRLKATSVHVARALYALNWFDVAPGLTAQRFIDEHPSKSTYCSAEIEGSVVDSNLEAIRFWGRNVSKNAKSG